MENDDLGVQLSQLRELREQRQIGHAEGQQHAIDDVNAGLVDDLIEPRLRALQEKLATAIADLEIEQAHADRIGLELSHCRRCGYVPHQDTGATPICFP